jgi:hypothetical protein
MSGKAIITQRCCFSARKCFSAVFQLSSHLNPKSCPITQAHTDDCRERDKGLLARAVEQNGADYFAIQPAFDAGIK